MDKLKQWVAITVVAVLVIVAAGWFLLVSPKRTQAAEIREQVTAQVGTNNQLKAKIQLLKSQAKSLPQKQAKLAAVAAKIPDNPALPALIRALSVAADDANVELLSMSPGVPTPVAPAAAAATTTSSTTTTSSSTTSTTKGAAPSAAAGSQAGTLVGIGLTLNVVGGYFQVEQFLDRLESLSRAVKVSTLSMSPGANPVKPGAGGAAGAAGAVAAAPATPSTLIASISATVYMATGRPSAVAPGK